MAKAKKQTTTEPTPAEAAAPAPKKAPAKKGVKKLAAAAKPAQLHAPMIDTNLAASNAARLVAHKDDLAAAASAPAHGESQAFKDMKESLHKPVGQTTPSFLQNLGQGKKFNNSVPGRNQQRGHNQTFGADVNRTGVPRRTGG